MKTTNMKNSKQRTITLEAQVTISRSENGVDYVQVMPDNPCRGMVEPFSGNGHGQMQSDGSFEFVRKKRKRQKPVLKLLHSTVSYGQDGMDRYTFFLPNGQRGEFAKLLSKEAQQAAQFMIDKE